MADQEKKSKRTTLNTTVDKEIKESFQEWCGDRNVTMGFMLEIAMEQIVSGELSLKFISQSSVLHEPIMAYSHESGIELADKLHSMTNDDMSNLLPQEEFFVN